MQILVFFKGEKGLENLLMGDSALDFAVKMVVWEEELEERSIIDTVCVIVLVEISKEGGVGGITATTAILINKQGVVGGIIVTCIYILFGHISI